MQRGHTLAADDALPFRVHGGRAYAYPLPFLLRLRPESAALLGLGQRTAPSSSNRVRTLQRVGDSPASQQRYGRGRRSRARLPVADSCFGGARRRTHAQSVLLLACGERRAPRPRCARSSGLRSRLSIRLPAASRSAYRCLRDAGGSPSALIFRSADGVLRRCSGKWFSGVCPSRCCDGYSSLSASCSSWLLPCTRFAIPDSRISRCAPPRGYGAGQTARASSGASLFTACSAARARIRFWLCGMTRVDNSLVGHAWVEVDERPIVDASDPKRRYTVVARYSADGRRLMGREGAEMPRG